MKEKCLTLIIGILIGAILASGGFLIYNNVIANNTAAQSQNGFPGGGPNNGEMPQGGPGGDSNSSSDSQKPSGEKPDGEPPAKPGENTTSTDTTSNT